MQDLKLTLHGLHHLSPTTRDEIIWMVKKEFAPLVTAAGKNLRIMLGPSNGDLNILFDSKTPPEPPCHSVILGEDGGQSVYVRVTRELRVCSTPDPKTGHRDLRRFLTSHRLLARALGNTAIHELGHFIADLSHEPDSKNYMITGNLPPEDRTLAKKREFFAGHQSFREDQRKRLIEQLKTGQWLGDFKFN